VSNHGDVGKSAPPPTAGELLFAVSGSEASRVGDHDDAVVGCCNWASLAVPRHLDPCRSLCDSLALLLRRRPTRKELPAAKLEAEAEAGRERGGDADGDAAAAAAAAAAVEEQAVKEPLSFQRRLEPLLLLLWRSKRRRTSHWAR